MCKKAWELGRNFIHPLFNFYLEPLRGWHPLRLKIFVQKDFTARLKTVDGLQHFIIPYCLIFLTFPIFYYTVLLNCLDFLYFLQKKIIFY